MRMQQQDTRLSVSVSLSHSRTGEWVTTPIRSRKLHRRRGSVDTLWSGQVTLRAWGLIYKASQNALTKMLRESYE